MEPLVILTAQLQSEQLTIPKFNEAWTVAMLTLDSIFAVEKWPPAKKLRSLIESRKLKIYGNVIIQAGIYLDPRFRRSLSYDEKVNAKNVIRSIFMKTHKQNDQASKSTDENPIALDVDILLGL